jgi:peptidoglycan/xylan/chitin deacetylase (PgdA/CDA1 family)
MKKILVFLLVLWLATGCTPAPAQAYSPLELEPNIALGEVPTHTPEPTQTATPTLQPLPTTAVLEVSPTPTALPMPKMVMQGPGDITCPILLYHRIAVPQKESPYFVTPDEFRAQMQALKDWGYTPILPSQLVDAIRNGALLPERPVVISFDDGDITVYTEAYPIMKELGFVGVNYLVANYINAEGYMSVDQLKELSAAGWEVGSHTMSHRDLTAPGDTNWQLYQSRVTLEELLGVEVPTLAYPYGISNENVESLARDTYRAAMGLGVYLKQGQRNLYYLWRRPVKLGWDVETFGSYLPWVGPIQP